MDQLQFVGAFIRIGSIGSRMWQDAAAIIARLPMRVQSKCKAGSKFWKLDANAGAEKFFATIFAD
ncbi:MAG: hypothetical protein P8K76_01110 [Candidatus Binatia bacterium]|nr:hypothetical protein [Candidatus Binatia bacterium]MDG2008355.1 hypothetical protein [Candidatus Binatia bacterium]